MKGAIRVLVAALSLSVAACAAGHPSTEKELADLKRELTKLRAEQAAADERLDALEIARGSGIKGYSAPAPAPTPSDRPELDVVKLAPDAADENDDPDADSVRPVLRSGSSGAVIEETPVQGKAAVSAKKDYEQAVELYRARQYDKALDALSSLLVKYPDHPNADMATYLRGECFFAKSEYRKAAEQYEAVASNYAAGTKAPDALLKAAQSYGKLGETASADRDKAKLLAAYPKSDAAKKLAPSTKKP